MYHVINTCFWSDVVTWSILAAMAAAFSRLQLAAALLGTFSQFTRNFQ